MASRTRAQRDRKRNWLLRQWLRAQGQPHRETPSSKCVHPADRIGWNPRKAVIDCAECGEAFILIPASEWHAEQARKGNAQRRYSQDGLRPVEPVQPTGSGEAS